MDRGKKAEPLFQILDNLITVEQLTYLSFDQSPLKGTSRSITIENQALDVQGMTLSLGINHGTTFIIAFMPDLGGNYTSKNHK